MLNKLKVLLGIELSDISQDSLLNLLISQCTDNAVTFTHNNDTESMESLILEMCVYRFNLIGSEGLTRETYSGTGYIYQNGYPDYVIEQLRSFRKLNLIG